MRKLVGIVHGGKFIRIPDAMPEDIKEQALEAELGIKREHAGRGLQIIPDIDAHMSTVDGSYVGGRAQQREHNRRNDVVVIGTEAKRQAEITRRRQQPTAAEYTRDIRNAWEHFDAKGYDALKEARDGRL